MSAPYAEIIFELSLSSGYIGSDGGRGDRDERERPRSRVRDSSRPRRDTSPSKRDDRERDRRDRDRERDKDQPREYRRGKDDFVRDRDRDVDGEVELEDPRRWRDDGKRDERIAARRERDRLRDRPPHEPEQDASSDRRWAASDERDARTKRNTGRDNKKSAQVDERKDRDDRRGDREKEKEPAWMDTYIPPPTSAGILGGKGSTGELDGIQAWKKGMKEKEQKEKEPVKTTKESIVGDSLAPANSSQPSDQPLDEIQLFRLMMKRERGQSPADEVKPSEDAKGSILFASNNVLPGLLKSHDQVKVKPDSDGRFFSPC